MSDNGFAVTVGTSSVGAQLTPLASTSGALAVHMLVQCAVTMVC